MWVCIGRLKEGLALLRHYLDGLDKQDRLLALESEVCGDGRQQIKELQDHFRSKNNKARYDYNTIVISLYGYLERLDRKSTRLNSSHGYISYAVFCLKKK